MDEHRFDMQILSWRTPLHRLPADQAIAACCAANDRFAAAITAHPDRFEGFAALPWPSPPSPLRSLTARSPNSACGEHSHRRPGAGFLDDPARLPVLEWLASTNALYVHPRTTRSAPSSRPTTPGSATK
ncbi:hypothetical protein ACIOD2_47170 [Amycolatopsis sp. NPDC088138]|uniref:hypothetical protein n=1 Tax=Amycolatopsis sp. NPDC088138 TaxID=3363938 RepID=UPI0038170002